MAIVQNGLECVSSDPNEPDIPEMSGRIFGSNPQARYWIGVVASEGDVTQPSAYWASGILRAAVYIDEKKFLPESARRPDRSESDADDIRSTRFVILENQRAAEGTARVIGTTRLIHRQPGNPLPVERMFPEAFPTPAKGSDLEASRFIARHPNKLIQRIVSLSLIRAMTYNAFERGSEFVYAVVEDPLAGLFQKNGLPFEQVAETKMIPEYNTENMAIRFDPAHILDTVPASRNGHGLLSLYFSDQVSFHKGLGFYDNSFRTPVEPVAA